MNSDDENSQPDIDDPIESDEDFYFEEVEENVVEKQIFEKKTPPIMWDYEKANIITKRKLQIDKGSLAQVSENLLRNVYSSYEIALLEFENGTIDYVVKRVIDGGYYELWKHNDFKFFPK